MPPAPEALLLLLDAAVTDDDGLMLCLIRRFPPMAKRASDLTNAERDSICASPYTNHFYTCAGKYGLVIEDRPTARALVQECNLNEHIFWGGNTDPVQFATIADIVDCMHKTSPKDSLLALMDSATNDESRRRKKPRPRASAVEADDYATAVRLASIAWLLKSLELWPKDAGHDAGKTITADMSDRISKVRDVDVLSAFIAEYLDSYEAEKLSLFVAKLLEKKIMIKETYKLPDGDDGPIDYWEKAYAAAKSSEWANVLSALR